MLDVRVVLRVHTDSFYLLRVERRGFDIYCFVPRLGAHFSRHRSGQSHFKPEQELSVPDEPPPVIMIGPAGEIVPRAVLEAPLADLGVASRVCSAIFPISKPAEDFRQLDRKTAGCFVIDTKALPEATTGLEIGVWAVPSRNKISFEWQHRDIPHNMVHRLAGCEPQVWVCARPAQGWSHEF